MEIFRCHPDLGLKDNKENFVFNASRDWKPMEMFLRDGELEMQSHITVRLHILNIFVIIIIHFLRPLMMS